MTAATPWTDARGLLASALIAGTCLLSVALFIWTGGNLALAAAPAFATAALYALWRLPLRTSAVALFFFSLALERPGDSADLYHTPFFPLGLALNAKYSTVLHVQALQFSGMDLVCLLLLAVAIWRAGSGSTVDARPVPNAAPLVRCALLYAATVCLELANGLRHGGEPSTAFWQLRVLLHLPLLFVVFATCLRGPRDFPALAAAVIAAACVRVAYVLWVVYVVRPAVPHREMGFVSNHDDSMLFAVALVILLVDLSERLSSATALRAGLLVPFLLWGMRLNNRRLAWVDLGFALLLYALLASWTPLKRLGVRALVVSVPALLVYVAVGWSSESRIFFPVRLARSVISSEADRSTLDRDIENWNLATTLPTAPAIGRGLGHEYDEKVAMDDISQYFARYRSFPHNSVLGIWVFFGLIGFLGLWPFFFCGLYLAARAFRLGRSPEERTAAFCALAMIVIFLNQCYGDMAFWSEAEGPLLAGAALAVAAKAPPSLWRAGAV